MASRQWAITACRAAVRLVLCAVTAVVVTLNGINPAAAAGTETVRVEYDGGIAGSRNHYTVWMDATVTRIGDQYELTGIVHSGCEHDSGPAQYWGLAFGSSAESWRYLQGLCGQQDARVKETGPLASDGRVYLQAGAYGDWLADSWGWGTQRSVRV